MTITSSHLQSIRRLPVSTALWLVVFLLLFQSILLSYHLSNQSMWTDEGFTAFLTRLKTPTEALDQIRRIERRPPLQFMSIWFWSQVAGHSDFSLRYFSVMCTLAATALTFSLGKRVVSENTGLWASLLMASAPTLLLYGRMTRGYAMTMALGLASTLTFWNAWHHRRPRDWLAYLLSTALLLTSDYPALAIVLAHFLYILTQWRNALGHWRRLLLPAAGMCVVLAAFWLTLNWQASSANIQGFSKPLGFTTGFRPLDYAQRLPTIIGSGVYILYSFTFGETIFPWNPIVWVSGAAMLPWVWNILRQPRRQQGHSTWSIVIVFFTTLVLFCLIVYGFILGGGAIVVAAARGLFIAPFFYLVLGQYGGTLADSRVKILTLVALLSARGISTLNLFADPSAVFNPVYAVPVRELATQVAYNVRLGDTVIFEEPLPFDLYFRELDATTPLFTPGPYHYGHTLGPEIVPGSRVFLGQDEPFISSIAQDRLLTYLQTSQPARLWLVVFHHEETEDTIETEIGQPLVQAGLYKLVSRQGYTPQDPLYSRLRTWMRPRTPIQYKAEILLYIAR